MSGISRREWLMAMACWYEVLQARAAAQQLVWLDAEGAADLGALADTILPGALDAGVVWFIDGSLAGHDRALQPAYRAGLKTIAGWSALAKDQRIARARDLERSDFFAMVRRHTVLGFFADPRHGGNRNGAAAKLLGFAHRRSYSPPFGYYDREGAL